MTPETDIKFRQLMTYSVEVLEKVVEILQSARTRQWTGASQNLKKCEPSQEKVNQEI